MSEIVYLEPSHAWVRKGPHRSEYTSSPIRVVLIAVVLREVLGGLVALPCSQALQLIEVRWREEGASWIYLNALRGRCPYLSCHSETVAAASFVVVGSSGKYKFPFFWTRTIVPFWRQIWRLLLESIISAPCCSSVPQLINRLASCGIANAVRHLKGVFILPIYVDCIVVFADEVIFMTCGVGFCRSLIYGVI